MSSEPSSQSDNGSDRRWLIPVVVIIVIGVAAVIAILATSSGDDEDDGGGSSSEYGVVEVDGDPLPPFDGEASVGLLAPTVTTDSLGGERVTLGPSDNTRLVGFFAHWCPHCQAEIPRVVEWLETNELPPGVEVIAVSTSARPDEANWPASEWFVREGWPEEVLLDDQNFSFGSSYGLTSFPYWVMLDSENRVITQAGGELSTEQFEALLAMAPVNQSS
jgi:cytochrome c biogenesis protein CcmG/thiol:disulfide interchange protein DsbE